jgi:hypothetical protein
MRIIETMLADDKLDEDDDRLVTEAWLEQLYNQDDDGNQSQ